jgi:serine/threonine-protein kinase
MLHCGACHAESPAGGRFCPHCAAPLDPQSGGPTRTVRDDPPPRPVAPHPSPFRSGGTPEGRFLPGTMLAGRYRIFGLVGRGGMGEVYRAEDVKLGQTVALKFLPREVERDEARLARFLEEVRLARQISHPNVCRVYDVGEADGQHFLSMEFVDGEDLAGLLRRIDRLPRDKAIQIAHQLCAGLAAAHEQGILHRDLKPSNVMIDGRGRARITDFGLARLAGEIVGSDLRAGTPAFMAPEQIAGTAVTVKSDLYSLGMVLYELCTGHQAFKAATARESARLKLESAPTSPSALIEGFDPAVERILLRCLERDPARRPATALAVAAALPGGDPLAAALAAGETPSPELVAEAGETGALQPALAWAGLAALLLLLPAAVFVAGRSQLARLVPLPKSPEILRERAREIVRDLGYIEPPIDSVSGFDPEVEYLDHVAAEQRAHPGWDILRAGPPYGIAFWYRQSPRPMRPWGDTGATPSTFSDPPLINSGMIRLKLDPEGHLRTFQAVPPDRDPQTTPPPEPDWSRLFALGGFDQAVFKPVEPSWVPRMYADSRAAWEGIDPRMPGVTLRLEAAAYRGRPIFFRTIEPWTRARLSDPGTAPLPGSVVREWGAVAWIVVAVAIMSAGVIMARRNLRLGRGDRKGALRLAAFTLLCAEIAWLLETHHIASNAFDNFSLNLAVRLLIAGLIWVFYLALEPYLRRNWPQVLVSWVRLLDGRLLDPLVGRDLLFGAVLGVVYYMAGRSLIFLPAAFGIVPLRSDETGTPPIDIELSTLRGLSHVLGVPFNFPVVFVLVPLGALLLLLLCRVVLRSMWLAVPACMIVMSVSGVVSSTNPTLDIAANVVSVGMGLLVVFRFGLLPFAISGLVVATLAVGHLTFDTTAWYAGNTLVVLLIVGGLALYGFRTSLGGRPAFGGGMIPEN